MQAIRTIRLVRGLVRRNSWFLAGFQALLFLASLLIAWMLRFDFALPDHSTLWLAVPVLMLVRMAAVARFGLLHGWWRYTGLNDVVDILKAVLLGSAAFVVIMRWVIGCAAFPRSVYVIEPLITAGLLLGVRAVSRLLAESIQQELGPRKRVILVGAGMAAQMVVREIRQPQSGYSPLGYLDDDLSKHGLRFHGVPVLGGVDDLPHLVRTLPVDELLIAVPSASAGQMQRFVEICQRSGVPFKTLPALREVISAKLGVKELRQVRLEDLLGREPVQIDLEAVRKSLAGRTVVVTGAAGSIGSELCRQILEYRPHKLVCIDQNETGMFYLERELSRNAQGAALIFCVTDVGDGERLRKLFQDHPPQVVFHAAAYKHVPVMEANVQGAVKNNIFGLLTLVDAAGNARCQSFVLVSSDKAVNPTSVMGATKRVGELIASCQPAGGMRCVSVRFGNVLGSNGSVVPVLQEQLQNNQCLTITHPDVKRFFMTTQEAVSLVLQAFAIGHHADTLVLDMGTPLRILDLARTLVRLSGRREEPGLIRFTGLREGEKLNEELFYPDEEVCPTSFPKIKRARGPIQSWGELCRQLDELRATLYLDGAAPVRAKIQQIVPEYSYTPSAPLAKSAGATLSDAPVDPQTPPRFLPAAVPTHVRHSLQPWKDRVNPA